MTEILFLLRQERPAGSGAETSRCASKTTGAMKTEMGCPQIDGN